MAIEFVNTREFGKSLKDLPAEEKLKQLQEFASKQMKTYAALAEDLGGNNVLTFASFNWHDIARILEEMLREDPVASSPQPSEELEEPQG